MLASTPPQSATGSAAVNSVLASYHHLSQGTKRTVLSTEHARSDRQPSSQRAYIHGQ